MNSYLKNTLLVILLLQASFTFGQNSFPLYTSGAYSGGSGDHTEVTTPQLKIQATVGYIRIPHISAAGAVSAVYNYETGKNVYWGEPTDNGNYIFRGRHVLVENGSLGIGTSTPDGLQINKSLQTETTLNVDNIRMGILAGTPRIVLDDNGFVPFEIDNASGRFRIFNPGIERFTIDGSGNVGIGTTTPDSKLTVKGDIHTREVKVDLAGAVGPDYVFEKDYPLTSLEELKSYIDQNKHLPEIPSAREMEENGINLKEMNLLLLKKVEELTLHLIEQNNQLKKSQMNAEVSSKKVDELMLYLIELENKNREQDELINNLINNHGY